MSSLLVKKKLGTRIVSQMTRNTAVRATSSDSLTKTGLAKIVAEEHELSVAKSERIVKTVFDSIVEKVSGKGVVRIADFGSFSSRHYEARTFNVPKTGGKIDKPALERPKFKAYNGFKKSVNK